MNGRGLRHKPGGGLWLVVTFCARFRAHLREKFREVVRAIAAPERDVGSGYLSCEYVRDYVDSQDDVLIYLKLLTPNTQ